MATIDEAVRELDDKLLDRSGRVFYTGRAAFEQPNDLYILGLNPGGSIERQASETIRRDLEHWRRRDFHWSAYRDESWAERPKGESPLQRRLRHLLTRLGRGIDTTPASNVIFTRSNDEAALGSEQSLTVERVLAGSSCRDRSARDQDYRLLRHNGGGPRKTQGWRDSQARGVIYRGQ